MEEIYYVYHIFRPEDEGQYDKGYIGITNNYRKRYSKHFATLKKCTHDNPYLQAVWNKYKDLQMKPIVITSYSNSLYIEEMARPNHNMGYNILKGGEGGKTGFKHSEESKVKMKEAWSKKFQNYKYKKRTPKYIQNNRPSMQSDYVYIIDNVIYKDVSEVVAIYNITSNSVQRRCHGYFNEYIGKNDNGSYIRQRTYYKDRPDLTDPFPIWELCKM